MAKEINTEILIHATPETIWAIFADFKNYQTWNPFLKSISGEVKKGNKIKAVIQQNEKSTMTFTPVVLAFEPRKELRWLGRLLFAGLFDGEHCFELIDHGNGTTTFRHSEKFNGILVPLFAKQLDNTTKAGFERMNRKLKELAEQNS